MLAITEYLAVYQFEFFERPNAAKGHAYQHALSLWTQECRELGITPDIGAPDVSVRSVNIVGQPCLIAGVNQNYSAIVEVSAKRNIKIVRKGE